MNDDWPAESWRYMKDMRHGDVRVPAGDYRCGYGIGVQAVVYLAACVAGAALGWWLAGGRRRG